MGAELLCVIYVVVLEAAPPPLDRFHRAFVRLMDLMVVLGNCYEAKSSLPTSSCAKMKSWRVMALLLPLVVGSMEAAPLLLMLPMRLALINSRNKAPISPGETTLVSLRWEPLATLEENTRVQH